VDDFIHINKAVDGEAVDFTSALVAKIKCYHSTTDPPETLLAAPLAP
jgi:hypothetical protein